MDDEEETFILRFFCHFAIKFHFLHFDFFDLSRKSGDDDGDDDEGSNSVSILVS